MGVPISNPDKALWPDAGDGEPVTKLDLARYYEAVGPWMLPHIKGRPCSIVRAPDGIGGAALLPAPCHARHVQPVSTWSRCRATASPISRSTGSRGWRRWRRSGGLELHPWNCWPGRARRARAGWCSTSIPAPDVGFDAVIEAARELKDRLEALGLVAFCKTTGGKGLHVVTPLAAAAPAGRTGPRPRASRKEICVRMAGDSAGPLSRQHGQGQAHRAGSSSTICATTAWRRRWRRCRRGPGRGRTVSMPLTWDQVRKGLDPKRFTLRTAPGLLAKSSAWDGYDDAARPLADAIRRLERRKAAA